MGVGFQFRDFWDEMALLSASFLCFWIGRAIKPSFCFESLHLVCVSRLPYSVLCLNCDFWCFLGLCSESSPTRLGTQKWSFLAYKLNFTPWKVCFGRSFCRQHAYTNQPDYSNYRLIFLTWPPMKLGTSCCLAIQDSWFCLNWTGCWCLTTMDQLTLSEAPNCSNWVLVRQSFGESLDF